MTEAAACACCGSPVLPRQPGRRGPNLRFCSKTCRQRAKWRRRVARVTDPARLRGKSTRVPRTCAVCGREFKARRDYRPGRGTSCSVRCHMTRVRAAQLSKIEVERAALEASVPGGASVEIQREALFGSGRARYVAVAGPKKCVVCGAPHPREAGGPGRRACCEGCRPAHERRLRERRRATMNRAKHRRRQRSGPFPWGAYRDADVFAADGWTCWLCARPVSRDVDACAPDRATIDHVLPLNGATVSGLDVRGNVRTACRSCNVAKGAQLVAPVVPVTLLHGGF